MTSHTKAIAAYPDHLLQAVVADGDRQNLSGEDDWWMAGRVKACRAECQRRGIPSKPGGRVTKPRSPRKTTKTRKAKR